MTREEIFNKVVSIIKDELEDEKLVITESTTANDVNGWDSLEHLSIVHEIEVFFSVKFTLGEIQGFQNVGSMINAIEKHVL